VNNRLARSLLPAAALLLLTTLALPVVSHAYAAKSLSSSDALWFADDQPQGTCAGHTGDQEPTAASSDLLPRLSPQRRTFLVTAAHAPKFSHTVSQARAPPLP